MPLSHDEKREVIAALVLSSQNPQLAIPKLLSFLQKARALGEWEEIHSLLDLIVPLLIHHRMQLDEAERLARELVQAQEDAAHLRLLSRVCGLLGKTAEAQALMAESFRVPSEHVDPADRAMLDDIINKP